MPKLTFSVDTRSIFSLPKCVIISYNYVTFAKGKLFIYSILSPCTQSLTRNTLYAQISNKPLRDLCWCRTYFITKARSLDFKKLDFLRGLDLL